ncbi:MAG: RNA polymerase factor sigma-32 [Magnetococcales bacterium]|nr:RNA polymerase factor sigma-32 [Magnetococcales bacterium]
MSRALVTRQHFYPVPIDRSDSVFRAFIAKSMMAPILSAEEELILAMRYRDEKDSSVAQTLVISHLRLVYKTAMQYRFYGVPVQDLVQEGTIGLMYAIKKFNPLLGARLSTYAIWWIRAAIHDLILNSWSLIKIATTGMKRKLFFKLRNAKKDLAMLNWDDAEELAKHFGTDTETILNMDLRLSGGEISLDQPTADGNGKMLDTISDDSLNQEEVMILTNQKQFLSNLFEKGISYLDPRDQTIIRERFLSDEPKTLEDLAVLFSVSRERIRQLEKKALGKLQNFCLEAGAREVIAG